MDYRAPSFPAHEGPTLDTLVAGGAAMQQAMREARRLAATDETSLIVGPGSGVGKRTFARAIHRASRRAAGPLVVFGPQSVASSMLASDLYGDSGQSGAFAQAAGGTLVVWHAEFCPAEARPRLLEVLRTGLLDGGTGRPHQARVLVTIAIPGRWPELEGLSLPRLTLPVFSGRDDLAELARHLLRQYAPHGPRPGAFLTDEARRAIEAHPWPGGAREMEVYLARAVQGSERDALTAHDLGLPAA